MTSPAGPPDLSKLRINRDIPSAPVRRALGRNVAIGLVALVVVAVILMMGRGRAVTVQTAAATPIASGGEPGSAGASVTANGYVVARTRASVAAKLPGRIADLRVSEGSYLKRGEIIARLENDDYRAQSAQADAALLTSRADLTEARAAQDVAAKEAERFRSMRAQSPDLVSEEEYDARASRSSQAAARAQAAEARIQAAVASQSFARANLENTIIRAPFSGTVL